MTRYLFTLFQDRDQRIGTSKVKCNFYHTSFNMNREKNSGNTLYTVHTEMIYFKLESKLYLLRIKVSENVFSNFDKIKGNFTKQRHYFLLLITFVNENIFCKKLCLYERFWLCIYKKKLIF